MQLTLVLGTALQQVLAVAIGRRPWEGYLTSCMLTYMGTVRIVEGLSEEITE